MPFRESRRSTRVPLKVAIAAESGAESLTGEGETVVVNLHGALLSTTNSVKRRNENLDPRLPDGQALQGSRGLR